MSPTKIANSHRIHKNLQEFVHKMHVFLIYHNKLVVSLSVIESYGFTNL